MRDSVPLSKVPLKHPCTYFLINVLAHIFEKNKACRKFEENEVFSQI